MAARIAENAEAAGTEPSFSSIEHSALRKVIGERIKSETKFNKHAERIIAEHTGNMRELLGSYDYEAVNLQAVIRNSAGMDVKELRYYLRMIEALYHAYASLFGKELAFLVVSGLLAKFRSSISLRSHYVKLIDDIEGRVSYYKAKVGTESRIIANLGSGVREMESGLFRIFRKNKIKTVKARMRKSEARLMKLNSRIKKFAGILEDMRGAAERQE